MTMQDWDELLERTDYIDNIKTPPGFVCLFACKKCTSTMSSGLREVKGMNYYVHLCEICGYWVDVCEWE